MNKGKKILACMLIFAILVSVVPTQMLMAEEETGTLLNSAIGDMSENATTENKVAPILDEASEFTATEPAIYYTAKDGTRTNIVNNTITLPTSDEGKFRVEGYSDGTISAGPIEWKKQSGSSAVSVGLYSGEIYCTGPGTISVKANHIATGKTLATFTIIAINPEITEIALSIDDTQITDTFTVAGYDRKTISVKGKYTGIDAFKKIPAELLNFSATNTVVSISDSGSFVFLSPAADVEITVSLKSNADIKKTFKANSTYVPIDSVTAVMPAEFQAHERNPFTGFFIGTGIRGTYSVDPKNASYGKDGVWTSDDKATADFESFNNGLVPYKKGSVGVKITCTDKGAAGNETRLVTGVASVNFSYKYPVEKVSTNTPSFELTEGASKVLDLTFSPVVPSEPGMKWEFSTPGMVSITQGTVELSKYTLTANTVGTVEVTGRSIDDTKEVKPVSFTVNILENSKPEVDVIAEARTGIERAKYFYRQHTNYNFGSEWDVFAQTRAGQNIAKEKIDAYVTSVINTYKGDITASETKPTTLARVALTLSSLGKDANNIDGLDFINMICNHQNLDGTSNDPMWSLLALDTKNYKVPENATWNRDKLIAATLAYQNADGGFPLSKGQASGVDITAMAIQALSNYQDRPDIKTVINKALDYLKLQQSPAAGFQDSGSYNCESTAQVIIALTSLGLNPTDPANGFVKGKNRNLITNIMSFSRSSGGFKHKIDDVNASGMPTQQALIALDSYMRLYEGKNRVFDMTDIESPENILPQITVTGITDNETINTSLVTLTVSAENCTQTLLLNNILQTGTDGTYKLNLKSGVNTILIKVTHSDGRKNIKTLKVTFRAQDYSKDINNLQTKLSKVINDKYDYKKYAPMTTLATFYQNRIGLTTPYYYRQIVQNVDKVKDFTVTEWVNTINVITAMGGNPENVAGVNILKSLANITDVNKVWSFADATEILSMLNTKNYNIIYENQTTLRSKLVATILESQKRSGGFGASTEANPLDTAKALIALRIGASSEVINDAVNYLGNNQNMYMGTTLGHLPTLSAVLTALSENGINISLDYRFIQATNIFTSLKAIINNTSIMQLCPEIDIINAALSINALDRINKKSDGLMNMSNTALNYGMLATDSEMLQSAKMQILKTVDFTKASNIATETMAIMLRTNVSMPQLDNYIELLKTHIKNDGITTAKEYFNTIMLIDSIGQNPENFDGINVIEKLFNLNMIISDEWVSALMTLSIGDYTVPEACTWSAEKLKAKIVSAYQVDRVPPQIQMLRPTGAVKVDDGQYALISYFASLNSLVALTSYKDNKDVYIDKTVEYISGLWSRTTLGSGNFNFSEVRAQMITALAFAGIDVRQDERFLLANESIMGLISECFVKDGNNYGFSISNKSNILNMQSALAVYTALSSLERIDTKEAHIYTKIIHKDTDFTKLAAKIEEAKSINQSKYTVTSYNALKSAIENAEIVLKDTSAIQNSVNVQVDLVQQSITALVLVGQPPVANQEARISIDGLTIGEGYFINGQTTIIEAGDTVYDILAKVVGNENLKTTGSGTSTYISSMRFNGKWLGEFDHGPLSGWMYSVNGKFPDISCGAYNVKSDDVIRWRYTKNLGVDIGDNSTNAAKPDNTSDTIIPSVNVPIIIDKNGQANAKMTEEAIKQLIATIKTSGDKAGTVVNLNATLPKNATGITLELPKDIIESFSKTKNTALIISSELGTLSLEPTAISEIAKLAKGKDIAISMRKATESNIEFFTDRPTYILEIKAGDENISSFGGGKINISFPYTPLPDEDTTKLTVYHLEADGSHTKMTGAKYNAQLKTMTFSTIHFSTFVIGYDENTILFKDVSDSHWANEYIYYLANLNIISGKTNTEFYPEMSITRAEFITMLARIGANIQSITSSSFSDVNPSAWYAGAIEWANQNKIVSGTGANTFSPNAEITRQDMAVMMSNYVKHVNANLAPIETPLPFADTKNISDYAQTSMKHLHQTGIIIGNQQNLATPNSQATRAESAAMLARLIKSIK